MTSLPPDATTASHPPLAWRRTDGLGLIRARGPDAREFLQSQLSNDVRRADAAQAQLSGYCSPKGRLLAVFTLFQLDAADSLGLELPAALLPDTLKRLRMFVLRSKLVLDDASADWPALALAGAAAPERLRALGLPAPEQRLQRAEADGVVILRRPGDIPRYLLRAAPERLDALAARLANLPTLTTEAWTLAELEAGVPVVHPGSRERFVPQTANLDLAGGISFDKGCYPGQEIVARVHYLGRLKQRLHLADCDQPGAPGQPVLAADGDGQAVGEVMDSAPRADGTGHRLALVLPLERPAGQALRLGSADGPAITHPQPAAAVP